ALGQEVIGKIEECLEAHDPAGALEHLWRLVSRMNKYVDETAPWQLAKDESQVERLNTVLHTFGEAIRILGILCSPFMPKTTKKIFAQLGVGEEALNWEEAKKWDVLGEGVKVQRG